MVLLVVDDNPAIRRMLGRVLGHLADHIRECADGSEAVAAYRELRPDLVLMDVEMQEVDGISATRQIMASFPEARVVIISQHGDEQMRAAARKAGACGYVLKDNLLELRGVLQASLPTKEKR